MAPLRTNRKLIIEKKILLERIETQSRIWILFSILSFSSIFLMAITISLISSTNGLYFLLGGIAIVSITWWVWTMRFILEATKNQKIIYKLLQDISFDIESIKDAIDQNFKETDALKN